MISIKNPPRILFANGTSEHGGAEEVLIHFMTTAREIGYEPILLVPRSGWLTEACEKLNIRALTLRSLPSGQTDTATYKLLSLIPNALRVAKIILRHRIQIVHSNTPRVSYYSGLAARLCGRHSVTHIHDIISLPFMVKPKAILLNSLSDIFLCVSDAVLHAIVANSSATEQKARRLYNGWDLSSYDKIKPVDLRGLLNMPRDSVIIGTAATMAPWKGQEILINAFSQLVASHPHCRLVIVGSSLSSALQTRHEQSLHKLVEELKLRDKVFFTGWREDCLNYIAGFDIFAHLPTEADPLPTAVIHASALGRPVVAAATGGIPEIVAHNNTGILVSPRNPEDACMAMSVLVDDATLRKKYGAAGRHRCQEIFTQDAFKHGLASAYKALQHTKKEIS